MANSQKDKARRPLDALHMTKMIERVDRDFPAAARKLQGEFDKKDASVSFNAYVGAAAAYRLAVILDADDAQWDRFCGERFWGKHSTLNRKKCLGYAFMYMYGGHQGAIAQRARRHARSVEDCWQGRLSTSGARMSAPDVFTTLRRRGFGVAPKAKLPSHGVKRITLYAADFDLSVFNGLSLDERALLTIECFKQDIKGPKFKIVALKRVEKDRRRQHKTAMSASKRKRRTS